MRCALRHPTCDGSRTGSPTFNSSCSAIHALLVQNTQTTLCSARHSLEERLSRWLLLAADRLDDRVVPVTHDMLSVSLGVRRASIIPRSSPLVQRRISAICRTLKYICSRLAISRSTRRTMRSRVSISHSWPNAACDRTLGHAAPSLGKGMLVPTNPQSFVAPAPSAGPLRSRPRRHRSSGAPPTTG